MSPDAAVVRDRGFFHGYTRLTWACITSNAMGGLVVGMVIKHVDSIVKDLSIGVSICLSAAGSVVLFGFEASAGFWLGTATVAYAAMLYTGTAPWPRARAKAD